MPPDSTKRRRRVGTLRVAMSFPLSEDDVLSLLGQPDAIPVAPARAGSLSDNVAPPRGDALAGLYTADPRLQYAALKTLATVAAVTEEQHRRVADLRAETPHLAIADLAEAILREKSRAVQRVVSRRTRAEVESLVRQAERRQREDERQQQRFDVPLRVPRSALVGWLASVALASFLLGGILSYAFLPHGPAHTTYADPNAPVAMFAVESEGVAGKRGFYCAKCGQSIAVRTPHPPHALPGPIQFLSSRPVAPRDARRPQ